MVQNLRDQAARPSDGGGESLHGITLKKGRQAVKEAKTMFAWRVGSVASGRERKGRKAHSLSKTRWEYPWTADAFVSKGECRHQPRGKQQKWKTARGAARETARKKNMGGGGRLPLRCAISRNRTREHYVRNSDQKSIIIFLKGKGNEWGGGGPLSRFSKRVSLTSRAYLLNSVGKSVDSRNV